MSRPARPEAAWEPQYTAWRHGGWYTNVRLPDGAVGCVSRNYPDRKWRIVCDPREGDHTYKTRDEAARAEKALVDELVYHKQNVGFRRHLRSEICEECEDEGME
jgi:hypothetical protein